jgi:hypothetical protein
MMGEFKQGTLMADLQEALEGSPEPDQIESLLSQVQGLFTRIETRRDKIIRQAERITQLERSRSEMRTYISNKGWGRRSAKANRAKSAMRRMLRALDEGEVNKVNYLVLRMEVEKLLGYVEWLKSMKEHEKGN